MKTIALLFALLLALGGEVAAQQVGPVQEAQARAALSARGVDEGELRRRLLQRGIDLDDLSPRELAANQAAIQAVVDEIAAENEGEVVTPGEAPDDVVSEEAPELPEASASTDEELEGEREAEQRVAEATADTTGAVAAEPSTIYGHDLFRNRTLEVFRVDDQIRAPGNYILDQGDELAISIFGTSQADLLLEIGRDGFIRPPQQPRIYLEGRTLEEARRIVRERMSRYYVFGQGEFTLTLSVARTVSLAIYGEVEAPGSYTLSGLNNVLNALVAAGGVTEEGTVRAIELQRDGAVARRIDVYAFLENASLAANLDIRDNDVIFVPRRRAIVTAAGGFERPLRYELLRDETLADLVQYAGGFTTRAVPSSIKITRYDAGRLVVREVDFDSGADTPLQNDDLVAVPVVAKPLQEFVTIEGEVLLAGRYGYRDGITAADIVDKGQPRPTARLDLAFLERTGTDGVTELVRVDLGDRRELESLELERGDVIRVLPSRRFVDQSEVSIAGAVRDPQSYIYPVDGGITLEEVILLAGGLRRDARPEAAITRENENLDGGVSYEVVPLTQASTYQLLPGDRVNVYETSRFTDRLEVSISGAVRQPGSYEFDESLDVGDLVYLSGGLSTGAQLSNVDVFRLDISDGREARSLIRELSLGPDGQPTKSFELRPGDEVVVRTVAEYTPIEKVRIVGQVRYPGEYAKTMELQRVSDIVAAAGGLSSDAFPTGATLSRGADIEAAVLTLDEILANPGGPEDLVVLDGDVIRVPRPQELVHISLAGTRGSTLTEDSLRSEGSLHVAYQGRKTAKWYIERFAGGYEPETSKRGGTIVVAADGQIRRTGGFFPIRDYPIVTPGATVIPGFKAPKPPKPERERSSWSDLVQGTLGLITTAVTVVLLIRQID